MRGNANSVTSRLASLWDPVDGELLVVRKHIYIFGYPKCSEVSPADHGFRFDSTTVA